MFKIYDSNKQIFLNREKKISVFENTLLRVDRALVCNNEFPNISQNFFDKEQELNWEL